MAASSSTREGLKKRDRLGTTIMANVYPNCALYWVICAKILLSSLETSWCFALYREKTVELHLETNIGKCFNNRMYHFTFPQTQQC